MKIGILGTGIVGKTIGGKMVELGHQVMMGSRTKDNVKAAEFVASQGKGAFQGTFADAAAFGEVIFNCTKGEHSQEVLTLAGAEHLKGKILMDVSNPLDFSKGFPPSLTICNTDSLGETLQRAFPEVKIVKTLNTMNCVLMMNPGNLKGPHDVFVCGNDDSAKLKVTEILQQWLGWENVIDLGDITNSRGTEMLLPIWVRLYGKFGNGNFNFHINRSVA